MEEPTDMVKLPDDMYDESMGDTEEDEEDEEIVLDIRQARHFFEEVNWESEKMEEWQWDLLYRYVPSPDRSGNESDRSYTTESIKESVKTFYKKKDRSGSVDEDNPIVEFKEGEDMVQRYQDVFTMYALLKMNVFKNRRQPYPPKMFGHCTYEDEDDDDGDEEADELSDDDDEPPPSRKSDSEEEEEKEKEKKPAKERRKLKKKKRREERRRLRDEVLMQKTTVEASEAEVDQHSDLSYLKLNDTFLTKEDEKKIDEVFSGNYVKYYSPHKRERTTTLPDYLLLGEEEPPINIAPNFKDLTVANLEKLNRTYFLHRVVYLFGYRTTDKIEDSNIEAPMTLKGYVAEQNTSYSAEYFVSGCLFFYKSFAVVMVEGGENEIMRHFLEMRGSPMLGEFLHGRVLYVHGHVLKRYFQHFVTCTADCTGPVDKIEKAKVKDIIQSFSRKMKNLYKNLPKMGDIFKPGCVMKLPESLAKTLPSVEQIKFLLKFKVLRKLPAFVNQFIEVPYVSDSSDEAWPPQDYEIPYNILGQGKRELLDLEKEMWAKVRNMKEKYKEVEKKRKKEEMKNKKLIREMVKRRKSSDPKGSKFKEKKVGFLNTNIETKTKTKDAPPKNKKIQTETHVPKTKIQVSKKKEITNISDKGKSSKKKEKLIYEKLFLEKDGLQKSILKTDNEIPNTGNPRKVKLTQKDPNSKKSMEKCAQKVMKLKQATVGNHEVTKSNEESEWITDESTVEQ